MREFSRITTNWKPLNNQVKFSELPQVTSSRDAEEILRLLWSDTLTYKEEFEILLLNTANKVLGICKISEGGVAGTVVDLKIVFQTALNANASSIILAHNHPSGNLKPSEADRSLTKRITEGGKLLDIKVLDHLILTYQGYYSFSDEGEM